jgi:NTP pyrophosphatase (non-canonical NTP hydrolase)
MKKKAPGKPPSRAPITTFSEYQLVVEKTDETKKRFVSLLGLVGEIGDLHSTYKKLVAQQEYPSLRKDLTEELGDVLWYLTSLASLHEIPLDEVAQVNAAKAELLYSAGRDCPFDSGFPNDEQFPPQFSVEFIEKPLDKGVHVKIAVSGVVIGDLLTDNAHEDDGYRYHDVFHLAYAAVLGWSPVTRALLHRKRKTDSNTDEIEDGARACIVEEAVSIFVFNQAPERGWYEDINAIDIGLLKIIKRLTGNLEVRECSAKQWKQAIHQGYKAFDALRKNRGGSVEVDTFNRKIVFMPGTAKGSTP